MQVLEFAPVSGATGVARAPTVMVLLDDDIDPVSVAVDQIRVASAVEELVGATTYDAGTRTLSWTTSNEVPLGTRLTATLRQGLQSTTGAPLAAAVTWTFAVVDAVVEAPLMLPVATAGADTRSIVAIESVSGDALITVASDLWGVTATGTFHETFPFTPLHQAATDGGAIVGTRIDNITPGTLPGTHELSVAVRTPGGWQQTVLGLGTGVWSSGGVVGGHGEGFACNTYEVTTGGFGYSQWWTGWSPLGGPLVSCTISSSFHAFASCRALDAASSLAIRGSIFLDEDEWQVTDYTVGGVSTVHTWSEVKNALAALDRTGAIVVLKDGSPGTMLQLRLRDGTEVRNSVFAELYNWPNNWSVLPGRAVAAAVSLDPLSGEAFSFRMDDSATADVRRDLAVPAETLASLAFEGCYADSGTLWLVGRVADPTSGEHSLQLWHQHADEDWSAPIELLPAVPGRILGRPSIKSDQQGRLLIAVPRTVPNEIVVLRAR